MLALHTFTGKTFLFSNGIEISLIFVLANTFRQNDQCTKLPRTKIYWLNKANILHEVTPAFFSLSIQSHGTLFLK